MLRTSFPLTKIMLSSILPRWETILKAPIQSLNDFLYGVCCTMPNVSFMRNLNISRNSLVDNKHINENSFWTLLSNVRYTVFSKFPKGTRMGYK